MHAVKNDTQAYYSLTLALVLSMTFSFIPTTGSIAFLFAALFFLELTLVFGMAVLTGFAVIVVPAAVVVATVATAASVPRAVGVVAIPILMSDVVVVIAVAAAVAVIGACACAVSGFFFSAVTLMLSFALIFL